MALIVGYTLKGSNKSFNQAIQTRRKLHLASTKSSQLTLKANTNVYASWQPWTPSKNYFFSHPLYNLPHHPSPYKAIQGAMAIVSPWFEDFLPLMVARLGPEGLVAELCKGFQLLMDSTSGLITFESLKRCSATLGLGDDEIRSMLREGDLDGDGTINQMEFCVLMLRLSPELMQEAFEEELELFGKRV